MTAYAEALAALDARAALGIRLGLDGVRAACAALGHPERAFPVLHVAGTNGKGTTAECLAALASAHGLRSGLATSPHIVEFRERIRVDGRPVGEGDLVAAWARVGPVVEAGEGTYFEAATLLAFEALAAAEVDVAVVEVGLGGRLDATNVVDPVVAAITNVALDHERWLGADLASIAREKAGIVKSGRPAIVGEPGPPAVRAAFEERARAVGADLELLPDAVRWRVGAVGPGGTRFDWASPERDWKDLAIPLAGAHFAADVALALRVWERAGLGPLEESPARAALAGLRPPGRLERVDAGGIEVWLDVGHNPDAARRLAGTLGALGGRAAVVAGILADKAWPAMLDALAPAAAGIRLCRLETAEPGRRLDALAAAPDLAERPGVRWAESVAEALDGARADVRAGRAERIVVTGSFHTVGEALLALGLARPGEPWVGRAAEAFAPVPAAGAAR